MAKEIDNSEGATAYNILSQSGYKVVYCDGPIYRNNGVITTETTEAVTAPDGTVYVSSNATLPGVEISLHEVVHISQNTNLEEYTEYESVLCENIDLTSEGYREVAKQINANNFGGKYDIDNIDDWKPIMRELSAYIHQYVITDSGFADATFSNMFEDWGAVKKATKRFNKEIGIDYSNIESASEERAPFREPSTKEIYREPTSEENYEAMLGERKDAKQRHITDIAKKLDSSLRLIWVDKNSDKLKGKNGKYVRATNTMYIARNVSVVEMYVEVFKHEFVHRLESRGSYKGFKDYLFKHSTAFEQYVRGQLGIINKGRFEGSREEALRALTEYYYNQFVNDTTIAKNLRDSFTMETAEREIVADFAGDILFKGSESRADIAQALSEDVWSKEDIRLISNTESSMDALEEIANTDRSLLQKIIDVIKDFITSLQGNPQSKRLVEDLEYIENRLARVYDSKDSKKAIKNAPGEQNYFSGSRGSENLYNTPEHLKPESEEEWSQFNRQFADKTNMLREGEKNNIVILTSEHHYAIIADGYMRGIIISKNNIDDYNKGEEWYGTNEGTTVFDFRDGKNGNRQGNNSINSNQFEDDGTDSFYVELDSFIKSHSEQFKDIREAPSNYNGGVNEPLDEGQYSVGSPLQRSREASISKNKSQYDEFNSNVMQWAYSASTKSGDMKIFNRRGKEFVLIEATEDGYIELNTGIYEELKEFERIYNTENESFDRYAETYKSIKRTGDSNLWQHSNRAMFGQNSRVANSKQDQIKRNTSTEDSKYVRSGDKGVNEPLDEEQYSVGSPLQQMRETVASKNKSQYDEFNSNVMQWAYSASTKTGDMKIFNRRGKEFVLIEATEDGYIELNTGIYEELKEIESAYQESTNTVYVHTAMYENDKGGNIADNRNVENQGKYGQSSESIETERFQTDLSGNDEYLRSGDKGVNEPLDEEQYSVGSPLQQMRDNLSKYDSDEINDEEYYSENDRLWGEAIETYGKKLNEKKKTLRKLIPNCVGGWQLLTLSLLLTV